MAELVRSSAGRFSISVHGCDHTDREFGTTVLPELEAKIRLAKERMERHRQRSHISHDMVMVFPQGVFSTESLSVLQHYQFMAAVNTDSLPINAEEKTVTIEEAWSVAILKYGSFPFFTRRYPSHGLENFAFDVLLGKPCLIVEHHEFFKGGGRSAIGFIGELNSMNCRLRWRGLGDVLRRSYQWRRGPKDVTHIKMFANELLLANEGEKDRLYQIEKVDRGSSGIEEITVEGMRVEWDTSGHSIIFQCTISAGAQVLIKVHYSPSRELLTTENVKKHFVRIALRRYLSEFRDNYLSRHASPLLALRAENIAGEHQNAAGCR